MTEGINPQLVAEASKYNKLAALRITQTQSFHDRDYSSVTLENNEFGLTEIIDPHPNLLIATHTTTFYWGKTGHPYDANSKCQIVFHDTKPGEADLHEIEATKQLILGATACKTEVVHASHLRLKLLSSIAELVGDEAVELAEEIKKIVSERVEQLYAEAGAPLAIIRTGSILRNGRTDNELVGRRVARLWFPAVEDPVDMLAAVQKTVREQLHPIFVKL